jgi:hypothetical protein
VLQEKKPLKRSKENRNKYIDEVVDDLKHIALLPWPDAAFATALC